MKIYKYVVLCFLLRNINQIKCQLPCMKQQTNLAINGTCPDSKPFIPCASMCIPGSYITGETECAKNLHCCFIKGTCYMKQLNYSIEDRQASKTKKILAEGFYQKATNETTDARSLNTGGPSITDFLRSFPGISICPKFPESCHLSYSSPEDVEPLTNIPYCQRIPCRPMNPMLESEPLECFSTPGCAYDLELLTYRSVLGYGFLGGVPLCHLVIKNQAFQKYATQYLQKSKQKWNPLLTNCLINHYRDEILKETKECAMVKVFEELGYNTKMAGWKGISSRDCHLINGCWRNNQCVYPLPHKDFKVLSSHNLRPQFEISPYGKPECLTFSKTLTSGEFLNAYHNCLVAGCSVAVNQIAIMQNLYKVTQTYLPHTLQNKYWAKVISGDVRADNWKEVADNLIETSNLPTTIFNRFGTGNRQVSPPLQNLLSNNALATSIPRFGILNTNPKIAPQTPLQPFNPSFTDLGNIKFPPNFTAADNNETTERSFSVFNNLGLGLVPPFVLPCPYVNIHWPGFPQLLGSFEGCCDKELCYMSRLDVPDAHSVIATYVSEWASWGLCSNTCGGGQQTRERFCIGDVNCDNVLLEQRKICSNIPCPSYTPWSAWSSCNATCGGGTTTRNRTCIVQGLCSGKTSDSVPCRTGNCPIMQRGRWSQCNTTCGEGVQRQAEICLHSGAYGCPPKRFHHRKCERFCGIVSYPTQSKCNRKTCKIKLVPKCLRRNGRKGHCRNMVVKHRKCYKGRCFCVHRPKQRRCRGLGRPG